VYKDLEAGPLYVTSSYAGVDVQAHDHVRIMSCMHAVITPAAASRSSASVQRVRRHGSPPARPPPLRWQPQATTRTARCSARQRWQQMRLADLGVLIRVGSRYRAALRLRESAVAPSPTPQSVAASSPARMRRRRGGWRPPPLRRTWRSGLHAALCTAAAVDNAGARPCLSRPHELGRRS
jgi:hypothetical protein